MITKQIMVDIKRLNLQMFSRNKSEQREVIQPQDRQKSTTKSKRKAEARCQSTLQ